MKTNLSTFNYNYAAVEPTFLSVIDFLTKTTIEVHNYIRIKKHLQYKLLLRLFKIWNIFFTFENINIILSPLVLKDIRSTE